MHTIFPEEEFEDTNRIIRITDVTSGEGTAHPSGAPEVTPDS
jgi:hypothetical protein